MDQSERFDRPGQPHGAGTLSSHRGLPDNPAQNRRLPGSSGSNNPIHPRPGITAAAGNGNLTNLPLPPPRPPPPPMPTGRSKTLTASAPISSSQVIALAREAMQDALRHADQQVGDGGDINNVLKPGLTIDLSAKRIQKLPDEVVDIIMNKLERLALSRNELSSFPARFAECSSLRYLNVRDNDIREFPLPLCDLRSLEILDLGRNKLRFLPPQITKLTSLKVFAVQKNRIEELPLCLADMASLQMLKLDDNPIRFPPPEVFQVQACSPPNEGYLKESEVTEVTVTSHVKKFLKQAMLNGRAEAAAIATATAYASIGPATGPASASLSGNGSGSASTPNTSAPFASGGKTDAAMDDSPDPPEPARFGPPKRVTSGRFPIKVNGSDVGDLRSPNPQRPPPIPTRSHYRGLSQQNSAVLRPGVMPLTIGSVNERVRSNSETTLLVAGRGDRSAGERSVDRSRRMGIVSKKAQELGTLDETEANNRFSHYRGLSHGSAMTGHPVGGSAIAADVKSPASPISEGTSLRPVYVRRLSVLPERRRVFKFCDPVVDAAKGILYSVFQIHPMIQVLMSLANDGSTRRSSLEIVVYNTNSHVQQLEREIQRYEAAVDNGDMSNLENESVHSACVTLLHAYDHICSLLKVNVDLFLDNGDPRYMRTLLLHLYHGIMELRVASAGTFSGRVDKISIPSTTADRAPAAATDVLSIRDTLKPLQPPSQYHPRDAHFVPNANAERPGLSAVRGLRDSSLSYNPSNYPVVTDAPVSSLTPHIAQTVRTITAASATPHADELYAFTSSRGSTAVYFSKKEGIFEEIYMSLQKSTDVALQMLPGLRKQYAASLRAAAAQRAPERFIRDWRILLGRCTAVIQQAETLKSLLTNMKPKGVGAPWQDAYWVPCVNFFDAWYSFADSVRSDKSAIQLPVDTKARLRPLHQCIKDTTRLILRSPWAYTLRQSSMMRGTSNPMGGVGTNEAIQLPMTPQSAALGPAVQATVPFTPQGTSFNNVSSSHLPERADTMSSDGGTTLSRTATSEFLGLDSATSTLFAHEADSISSFSTLSPGVQRPFHYPPFSGNKVAF
ncbi:RAM signaling network component [Sporothrix epigloea]|uniref:RAM signaling network component n=1 Tax=Sporothrix epigloea TaxID=1892477 RepID=A0ABP0DTH9_9PEZI